MTDEYRIVNAHTQRNCRPDTCWCPRNFVVLKNNVIYADVNSKEEGLQLIERDKKGQTVFEFLKSQFGY